MTWSNEDAIAWILQCMRDDRLRREARAAKKIARKARRDQEKDSKTPTLSVDQDENL